MVLMAYDESATLGDRFAHARQCLIEMAPGARRPSNPAGFAGKTYQGFVKAAKRLLPGTLDRLQAHLRKQHQRIAGASWKRYGWVIVACDGSRVEVPRTLPSPRTVRDAMRTPRRWRRRGDLRVLLATARKDSYQRHTAKKARNWPHK